MKAKISKWGNSLAVRLPKHVADELSLTPGKDVEIAKEGTRLTIETAPGPKIPHFRLEDLLAQIKPGQESPPLEGWSAVEPPWPDDDWSDMAPTEKEWDAMRRVAEAKLAKRRSGSA